MEKKIISLNVEGFIVPNHSDKVEWFKENSHHSPTYSQLLKMAEFNNIRLSDEDETVQMWFVGKDVVCDNISNHKFEVSLGETKIVITAYGSEHIPLKLIKGIKEGDMLTINVPALGYPNKLAAIKWDKESAQDIILTLNITFKQRGHRYEKFGNFEDVLSMVCQEQTSLF